MRLEVQLLGHVELRAAGTPIALGAPKRRAVLAGLALDANHPVPLRRLVEMAWPDSPPASAIANLRSHVAALRQTVGDRIMAYSGAYRFRLAPDELDVTEFLRLAGAGQASLLAQDFRGAIAPLAAALALWRGVAGDGVPRGTILDSHWVGLDEQRLQVFDDLTQVRLAVGEDAGLVGELRRHVAAHPLRERTWEHLMLALYRSGDVSAALEAYRRARAVLDDQLGIEPGEDLATLHRAILERSVDLLSPVTPAPSPAVTARPGPLRSAPPQQHSPWQRPIADWSARPPRELPADVVSFVGRTRDLAAVMQALRSAAPAAVVISGAAGSGKSSLAIRTAHLLESAFPDGQIYIDLGYRPKISPGDVLARALRALGIAGRDVPASTDERAGRLRSLIADRRLLLVVDGVANAGQVRPLLPAAPGPALLAIGHRRLRSLDGTIPVVLEPMEPADAFELLAVHTGNERLAAETDATADLIRLCAGSPLALRIAGSRLADRPGLAVHTIAEQLRDRAERLDWLVYEDLSVHQSLATAHAALGAADQLAGRAFVLLGDGAGRPRPTESIADSLGVSAARAVRALDALVDAHLADQEPAGYRLRPLVRDYAAGIAARPRAYRLSTIRAALDDRRSATSSRP